MTIAHQVMLYDEQITQWRTEGMLHVTGLLTTEEVAAAHEDIRGHFPTREEFDARPDERPPLTKGLAFRSMPFAGDQLHQNTFHPVILDAVARMVGTTGIRVTQSLLRASYATEDTTDQMLHRDFHNNSLLTPPFDLSRFAQVPVILYYTDVEIGDAPTYVAPYDAGLDQPILPSHVPAEVCPEIYEWQRPILARAGDAFFYSMRTWHRGSRFTDPTSYRFVHHLAYRAAGQDWMDHQAWPFIMDTKRGRRCIETLDPRQREVIGIPAPGHEYWTAETVEYFEVRYPGADSRPYRDALGS